MKTYRGGRSLDGAVVTVDGRPLPPRYDLKRLSSTGFEWTVTELLRGRDALRGTVTFQPDDLPTWAPLLDAVMTLAPVAYPGAPVLRMVVEADEIVVQGEPPKAAVIDIAVRADRPDAVDVTVAGPDDTVLGRITGLRYAVIGGSRRVTASSAALPSSALLS